MTTPEITAILTAGAALLTAAGGFALQSLRWRRERGKFDAEAAVSWEELDAKSRERIEEQEAVIEDQVGTIARLERERRTCEEKLAAHAERLDRLEKAYPILLMLYRMGDWPQAQEWFDSLSDPIVASTSADEGTLIWCNKAFCEALQMTKEEILKAGWRRLCDPSYLDSTRGAETSAWGSTLGTHVNAYLRKDGRRVLFRWRFLPYWSPQLRPQFPDGVSLARARIIQLVKVEDEDAA